MLLWRNPLEKTLRKGLLFPSHCSIKVKDLSPHGIDNPNHTWLLGSCMWLEPFSSSVSVYCCFFFFVLPSAVATPVTPPPGKAILKIEYSLPSLSFLPKLNGSGEMGHYTFFLTPCLPHLASWTCLIPTLSSFPRSLRWKREDTVKGSDPLFHRGLATFACNPLCEQNWGQRSGGLKGGLKRFVAKNYDDSQQMGM